MNVKCCWGVFEILVVLICSQVVSEKKRAKQYLFLLFSTSRQVPTHVPDLDVSTQGFENKMDLKSSFAA